MEGKVKGRGYTTVKCEEGKVKGRRLGDCREYGGRGKGTGSITVKSKEGKVKGKGYTTVKC